MIIVTGAAGFIAGNLLTALSRLSLKNLVAVDDFSNEEKNKNLANLNTTVTKVDRSHFNDWMKKNGTHVSFVFHLGARTDTTLQDLPIFEQLNLGFSKMVWQHCVAYQIPLVYASSAATYGNGEHGYDDNLAEIPHLKPLNPYGDSKNDFDNWVLQQKTTPPFWAGLKFFNVYGPNEYHKGRMASVIFHCFNQIKANGTMKLFMSHKEGIANGEQKRDFIYVKDVIDVCLFLMENKPESNIYNLGSGTARTFNDLVENTFKAMGMPSSIAYIPTPEDIRDSYQYFTEASMYKLQKAGYAKTFTSLEDGIDDYVKNYLMPYKYF